MNIIKDLLEILPQIIIYIVTGYVFVKTFHFVALKQNSTDVEHILTVSLVTGYVYNRVVNLIPISISYEIDTVLIILSALFMGYVIARITRSKYVIYLLDLLKIRDTGNLYLWDDVMDNDYPMKIVIAYEDMIYEGMLHNYESYSNEPHIVICSYTIKHKNGDIIKDMSDNCTEIVILNTENASSVTITYDKNSMECEDLKNLCEAHKK